MLIPRLPSAAPHVVLGLPATSGTCSVIAGWTWRRSLCALFRVQLLHMLMILFLVAPFSWRIWFIRLLFPVLTRAHLLHADFLYLAHVVPGAHRIWCKAHKPRRDWGINNPWDDPPIYCVWDTSVCYVCLAGLEIQGSFGGQGFRGLVGGGSVLLVHSSVPRRSLFLFPVFTPFASRCTWAM